MYLLCKGRESTQDKTRQDKKTLLAPSSVNTCWMRSCPGSWPCILQSWTRWVPSHRGITCISGLVHMIPRLAAHPAGPTGGVLASSCQIPVAIRGQCITQAAPVVERDTAAAAPAAVDFIRPHLRQLSAYTPIEPFEVLSARLGRRPEDIIKLDANENPYGPPQAVRDALAAMPFPHIYPDPESRRLREALAEVHGVPMQNLLVSSTCF